MEPFEAISVLILHGHATHMCPPIRSIYIEFSGLRGVVPFLVFEKHSYTSETFVFVVCDRATIATFFITASVHAQLLLDVLVPMMVFTVSWGGVSYFISRCGVNCKEDEADSQQSLQKIVHHITSLSYVYLKVN